MMSVQIATMLVVFFFSRLYDVKRTLAPLDTLYRVFAAVSIGTISTIAFTTLLFKNSALELDFPRVMTVYAWLVTAFFVMASRSLLSALRNLLRKRGAWAERVLIVGTGDVGRMILQKVRQSPGLGYRVAGFVDDEPPPGQEILGVPVLGGVDDLPRLVREHGVEEVIIGRPETQPSGNPRDHHLPLRRGAGRHPHLPGPLPVHGQRSLSIGDLGGLPLLAVRDVALRGWKLTLKRRSTWPEAGWRSSFCLPFLMLVAVAVKLDCPGSGVLCPGAHGAGCAGPSGA